MNKRVRKPDYLKYADLEKYREDNKPDRCPILNSKPRKTWCVDHDHSTGLVRGVISDDANILLGKIENHIVKKMHRHPDDVLTILENICEYIMDQPGTTLHPVGVSDFVRKFKNLKASEQKDILESYGVNHTDLKNTKQRCNAYRKVLTSGAENETKEVQRSQGTI